MKRLIMIVMSVFIASALGLPVAAAPATSVQWHTFWVSLPDANSPSSSFAPARDALMDGLKKGGVWNSAGRESNPAGMQVCNVLDVGDLTTSTNKMWRYGLNPPSPFSNEKGNRAYCASICIGVGGQVDIQEGISWKIFAGPLSNQRNLAGLPYSVDRIGIKAGPDGKLWTSDDVYMTSGTGLVDAIAYIGAAVLSPTINTEGDKAALDAIFAGGLNITAEYAYGAGGVGYSYQCSIMAYSLGQIPYGNYKVEMIRVPAGFLGNVSFLTGAACEIRRSTKADMTGYSVIASTVHSGFCWQIDSSANPMEFFCLKPIP